MRPVLANIAGCHKKSKKEVGEPRIGDSGSRHDGEGWTLAEMYDAHWTRCEPSAEGSARHVLELLESAAWRQRSTTQNRKVNIDHQLRRKIRSFDRESLELDDWVLCDRRSPSWQAWG
jgi:hypothetical protein